MKSIFKRILYFIIGIVIIGLIIYPKLPEGSKSNASPVSDSNNNELFTVDGIVVTPTMLNNTIRITGTIQADETVDLNSEVSGKIEDILFKEGEFVSKGEHLVILNDDELIAELEKLRFTKKLLKESEYRQRLLLEKEAISQEEYDIALTELNTANADINVTQAKLDKHIIKAPFDGKIGLRNVSIGSYINPGELIARVYKMDRIKLDFSIPGRYLSKVNIGDKLSFKVDAYNETFFGTIYAIEPQINLESRNLKVRAYAKNTDGKLLPGQFAKIDLILEEIDNAFMLPTESVIPELNGQKVFVYQHGTVGSKSITTGIRNEDKVQVTDGLMVGDTVITSGILQIRQGMPVKVNI